MKLSRITSCYYCRYKNKIKDVSISVRNKGNMTGLLFPWNFHMTGSNVWKARTFLQIRKEKCFILRGGINSMFDIVWTVYRLVIYMHSNKIHNVVLMSKFYSALMFSSTCFGPHRSIIRSVLCKLYSQTLVPKPVNTACTNMSSQHKCWIKKLTR